MTLGELAERDGAHESTDVALLRSHLAWEHGRYARGTESLARLREWHDAALGSAPTRARPPALVPDPRWAPRPGETHEERVRRLRRASQRMVDPFGAALAEFCGDDSAPIRAHHHLPQRETADVLLRRLTGDHA